MSKDLVIVESPAKARTVGQFLGKKFQVKASMGQVRDLPRRSIGVEIDDDGFKPKYTVSTDKKRSFRNLGKQRPMLTLFTWRLILTEKERLFLGTWLKQPRSI